MSIKIPNTNKSIGPGEPVLVVAEIGKNFIQTKEPQAVETYLKNAKELVKAAKEVGANAVKFQTHNTEDEQLDVNVISPHFKGSDRYHWVKRNDEATPLGFWHQLKAYCDDLGLIFFSTPMSRGAAQKLEKIGVPMWKVGSGDVLDFLLLDYIAATGKPIIMSAGMSTIEEVDKSVEFLKRRAADLVLLHCVSRYPCPPEDLNIKTITYFQKRYGIPVGFSDHSLGYESVWAAVELGAVLIEKHFSFSRDFWGSDHKVSMLPEEFSQMVKGIRAGTKVDLVTYGEEIKILQEGEEPFRPLFRKSLMASSDLPANTILKSAMVYAMRPQQYAGGLPSEEYETVLGKKLKKSLKKYDPITKDILTD